MTSVTIALIWNQLILNPMAGLSYLSLVSGFFLLLIFMNHLHSGWLVQPCSSKIHRRTCLLWLCNSFILIQSVCWTKHSECLTPLVSIRRKKWHFSIWALHAALISTGCRDDLFFDRPCVHFESAILMPVSSSSSLTVFLTLPLVVGVSVTAALPVYWPSPLSAMIVVNAPAVDELLSEQFFSVMTQCNVSSHTLLTWTGGFPLVGSVIW